MQADHEGIVAQRLEEGSEFSKDDEFFTDMDATQPVSISGNRQYEHVGR